MIYFIYSRHSTEARAYDALENYFAEDIICDGERPKIEKHYKYWCVMFPG